MMQSELLLHTSWPIQSYFHSNLDHYDPNVGFYASGYHEFPSLINSSPEDSSEYKLLGYNQMQNIDALDDVCQWLYDEAQQIEEIQSELSIEHTGVSSPDVSMKSSDISDCFSSIESMELESETGLENLLKAYAEAMAMGQRELAKVIVKCIIERINPMGQNIDRIAFNLFRCSENEGEHYLTQESARNYEQSFRAFYEIFPYGRFAHFTANSAILEAIPIHVDSIHIVDFDMGEGCQWPTLIEAFARMKKRLTITSVKLPDRDSGFEETKRQLVNNGRTFGINLTIEEIELAQMAKAIDGMKLGSEFVAFNCMVGLPHMGRTRSKSQVIEFVKVAKGILAKNEGIITYGDGEESDRSTHLSDFSSYFNHNLALYKAIYESMEWGFPSHLNEARIAMETLFLAPFVSSFSWYQKWEEGKKDGFFDMVFQKDLDLEGLKMSNENRNEAREMVKEGETPYKIKVEGENENEMVLEWRGASLVRVYSWR